MRLTRKRAIDISIRLWTWMAEDGTREKGNWPGWKRIGPLDNECALCEYAFNADIKGRCTACPYREHFYGCGSGPYALWCEAMDRNEDASEHAKTFLAQLKEL